ncbi:MarR family transcriptional regulator [Halosquirtibacter xylanolyticus]|uniref:MarR family transcriptional regulator n=1 Tax=Halosquirtibacter xylanolyticus TaxID=3374599 RepID=UPI0037484653|nr:MarR family transcriptional regulator [Prolixibacteraceae bacterium]
MEYLKTYLKEILGEPIGIERLPKNQLKVMPLYIYHAYNIYETTLLNQHVILLENKNVDDFKISQTDKHIELLREAFSMPVVLVLAQLASYNRLRLIDKRINFIVPGKQLFIPDLMMDLRESFAPYKKQNKETLTPSAQLIVLYHILNRDEAEAIKNLSFKEIAEKLVYSSMAITKAVENLKQLDLIEVQGLKEKRISFVYDRIDLWKKLKENGFYRDPVLKRVFVDEIPHDTQLLRSNESALTEYSDMNPSRQLFFAIEKNAYYALQKSNKLVNENKYEGRYCLEVWKYNPLTLAEIFNRYPKIVDPLSLFISFMGDSDERIEMALEQIEEKYLW